MITIIREPLPPCAAPGCRSSTPARFGDPAVFRREVDAVVAHLKGSPPADPGAPVMVAGEPEVRTQAVRLASGIPMDARQAGGRS